MKQLDMEQAEEMPSSTLTSREGITQCHTVPILSQRLQITSETTIEGQIVTETDMPPLTGETALSLTLTQQTLFFVYFNKHAAVVHNPRNQDDGGV